MVQPGGSNRVNPNVDVIRNEYRRLDIRWLKMQYHAVFWMVLFATAAEIVMFFILHSMNAITISSLRYGLKYVLTPLSANLVLLLFANLALKSKTCSDEQKIYTVSIVVALCCFVVYTVHAVFVTLNLIYTIPMVLTVVYADRRLTSVISLLCLAEKTVSDLFFFWDSDKASIFSSNLALVDFFMSLLLLLIFYAICLFIVRIEHSKNNFSIGLEQERQRLQIQAATDPLTGIGNRQALRKSFSMMEKSYEHYTLAMIDLDYFKSLNDTHGHTCGDSYLVAMGQALQEISGDSVTPFRFGGDEFCILFEGKDQNQVDEICQRLQKRFQELQGRLLPSSLVTMSVGIAEYQTGEKPSDLLQRADLALYRAKQQKGTICLAQEQ